MSANRDTSKLSNEQERAGEILDDVLLEIKNKQNPKTSTLGITEKAKTKKETLQK